LTPTKYCLKRIEKISNNCKQVKEGSTNKKLVKYGLCKILEEIM